MRHLTNTISDWKSKGLLETRERREEIFWIRESSTNCEKCGKEFKSAQDRHMDHCHETGRFRNILCSGCNLKRCKIHKNNTSGYLNIHKQINKKYKQGFIWVFRVNINGKRFSLKRSIDKEYLIEFAKQWKIDNNYDN